MMLILVSGCSTTKLEERIAQLEQKKAEESEAITQWATTVEERMNAFRYFIKRHDDILKKMNADGVRVQ
jgi:uncharacterized coiled-coil protein SlyX